MFDLTAHLTPDLAWRKAGGVGGVTPAFQADFTALSALPAQVSFSRASNAMVFDSTGKLTFAPNNLLINSNDFTQPNWAKTGISVTPGVADPFGGTAASTITATATDGELVQTLFSQPIGVNWVGTIWARRRTGSGSVIFYNPDDTVPSVTLTSSWQQLSSNSPTRGTGNVYIDIVINTSGDAIDIYAPTLSQVTYETAGRSADQVITTSSAYYGPRFDHAWNGSAWVATGLLIEEQRTNLITHSTDLTATGWNTGQLLALSSVMGIDGTNSAYKLTPDTSSSSHYITSNSFTTASPFVFRSIVTANGYNQVSLRESNAIGSAAVFSLSGGGSVDGYNNIAGLTASDAKIKSVGNGRFLISCLMTPTGPGNFNLGIIVMDGSWAAGDPVNAHYAGNGTSGIIVECPQAEVGSFATSYIPTTTAAVTRSVDIVQLTGAALTAAELGAASVIAEIGDAPAGRVTTCIVGFGDQLLVMNNGNVAQYNGINNLTAIGGYDQGSGIISRAGFAWDAGNRSVVANGGTVATQVAAPFATPYTDVFLGRWTSNDNYWLNGHFRSIAIYSSRLSDADLQTKSVVGASF